MTGDDFDWRDDDAVVLQEQPATAVYVNTYGAVIVRQQNWPDEDVHVMVRPENAKTLADAILNAARSASTAEAVKPAPGKPRMPELALVAAAEGGGA